MRTLPFTVEGQTLRKDGDFGGIISGSKGVSALSAEDRRQ